MTTRDKALIICSTLINKGYNTYFVGGCVRDEIRGLKPKDYDIVTSAHPDRVEELFKKTIPVGKQFGVINVVLGEEEFEVATLRSDSADSDGRRPSEVIFTNSISKDSERRDFTINAMYMCPLTRTIYDFHNGRSDLKNGVIKFVGDPVNRIKEDHLRMLRAFRFARRFNFNIEESSLEAIKNYAHLITGISSERIKEEMDKVLISLKGSDTLRQLDDLNLLKYILPEVHLLKHVEQDPHWHPEGNVLIHTDLVLSNTVDCDLNVKWAAIFHDIGKKDTFKVINDRITAHGHDKVGSEQAEDIMARLKFSNKDIKEIKWLVRNHMIHNFSQRRKPKQARLAESEYFNNLLELHKADCLGSSKDTSNLRKIKECLKKLGSLNAKLLINGMDLTAIGLTPGPEYGKILRAVRDAQYESLVKTKEEAINFVKEWVAKNEQ